MMIRSLILSGVFFILFITLSSPISAFRLLPRYGGAKPRTVQEVRESVSKYLSVRLRNDRKALILTFQNLAQSPVIEYTLTYRSKGEEQGIVGRISSEASSGDTRELLFGTQSSGTTTYHQEITDMKLLVTVSLPSGLTLKKTYIVKP